MGRFLACETAWYSGRSPRRRRSNCELLTHCWLSDVCVVNQHNTIEWLQMSLLRADSGSVYQNGHWSKIDLQNFMDCIDRQSIIGGVSKMLGLGLGYNGIGLVASNEVHVLGQDQPPGIQSRLTVSAIILSARHWNLLQRSFCSPATPVPLERIFSTGGLIMRPHRARMSNLMLEWKHLCFWNAQQCVTMYDTANDNHQL